MTCTNCGNKHQENYCPNCGEKRFHPEQLSLKHYLEETAEGLFHFDNKFLLSLKALLLKPGQLSLDYVEGRRVRWVKPFPFFLLINLIAFLFLLSNPFSLPLENYVNFKPFVNYHTAEIIKEKIAEEGTTFEAYAQHFNDQMHISSKALLMLFIPVYALIFSVLFINKRRTFTEHLVFSTHYMAFVLLLFLFVLYLVSFPIEVFGPGHGGYNETLDQVLSMVYSVALTVYLFFAIRKFYKPHIIQTILVAALVGWNFFFVLQFYRMVVFYKVVYLTH